MFAFKWIINGQNIQKQQSCKRVKIFNVSIKTKHTTAVTGKRDKVNLRQWLHRLELYGREEALHSLHGLPGSSCAVGSGHSWSCRSLRHLSREVDPPPDHVHFWLHSEVESIHPNGKMKFPQGVKYNVSLRNIHD